MNEDIEKAHDCETPDTSFCSECGREPVIEPTTHEPMTCDPECEDCSEPVIELGTDYTRVKPAIKNIAESLLQVKEAAEQAPEASYYIWTKYETHHTADVVSGLGMGVHVRVPIAYRTPESELRFKILGTLKGKDARDRAANVRLFCVEKRNA